MHARSLRSFTCIYTSTAGLPLSRLVLSVHRAPQSLAQQLSTALLHLLADTIQPSRQQGIHLQNPPHPHGQARLARGLGITRPLCVQNVPGAGEQRFPLATISAELHPAELFGCFPSKVSVLLFAHLALPFVMARSHEGCKPLENCCLVWAAFSAQVTSVDALAIGIDRVNCTKEGATEARHVNVNLRCWMQRQHPSENVQLVLDEKLKK